MSCTLPIELLCHILSFLPYQDLYLTRGVSRYWRSLVEEHIYLDVKTQQHKVSIVVGQTPFTCTLDLYASNYDSSQRVVEFTPRDGQVMVSPRQANNTNLTSSTVSSPRPPSSSWHLYHHRQLQIQFSNKPSHPPYSLSSLQQALSKKEQEQALFHLRYNPVLECSYGLPAYSWLSSSDQTDQHYVGDKTMILSFSYVSPTATTTTPSCLLGGSSPPCAPQIQIHWLRVTLDWIISFTQPKIQTTQIYADRYAQLYRTLAHQYGCYKYDELSEPVLDYIIHQDKYVSMQDGVDSSNNDNNDLFKQLVSYVQEHSHEYHTRLSRLQHMLEGACVNPRMIWKYPFAKSFVVGNGSLLSEEDVVRRIQDSEEEWRSLSRTLKRRLGGALQI
ncbi:hypothetical protein BC941DRAFT_428848 [Chlamydoabsidia padenii]|nr:hypothetical protein BC941DRAFT_428848 [Chlamydoabsidia padenii]